jgi:type VI secretion system protein ImpF
MPSPNLDSERVLPCLLERLTDHYPLARKESREHRTLSLRKYRESVLRDLEWLLNCEAHPRAAEFAGYERVQGSVVNYGVPSLTGAWLSAHEPGDVEQLLRDAILRFEPRIVPETLLVRALPDAAGHGHNTLALEIVGQLWAEPVPEQLYIRTELDLDTGSCAVEKR